MTAGTAMARPARSRQRAWLLGGCAGAVVLLVSLVAPGGGGNAYAAADPAVVAAGAAPAGTGMQETSAGTDGRGGQDGQEPRPRPTGPLTPESCALCHGELQDHDVVHGPAAINACSACHQVLSVEDHTYVPAREGSALCTYCHDIALGNARTIHAPLQTGDCTGCHDPHGSSTRTLLKAESVDGLCASCHEDVTANAQHVHGPVAVGACTACHPAHASEHDGLLVAPKADLCVSCHATTESQLGQRFVHQPVQDDCSACHDPHASNHPMFLKDEPQKLCLGCHETIRHTVETATTQHAALTSDRQCLNCHDPHASDHPRMMHSDMKSLCFECHDREIELEGGGHLANMKKVLASGASLHGPVAQDNCAACHMIHGGDNFRMLAREYPPEFYASFAEERYALCFSCHDKALVHDPKTTALTDFRNGDLNLHFVHVNREKKGRTCRACHETHASSKAKHIRESVPFGSGGWELPIGFDKTDTGGSCAPGCHKPYGYDRVVPLPYESGGAPAIWPNGSAQGEAAAPSGANGGSGGG